jgi:hypothetical protein
MASPSAFVWKLRLLAAFCAAPGIGHAQAVQVTSAPRAFNVVPPKSWVPAPLVTGNTRVAFRAPLGVPHGECAVTAIEFKGQRLTQAEIDKSLAQPMTAKEVQEDLARSYNNVKVLSIGRTVLAGFKAQAFKFEYSVGTPLGEMWATAVTTTAAVAPNVSWAISCGSTGKTISEARTSFSHWQMDFNAFPTNFKF